MSPRSNQVSTFVRTILIGLLSTTFIQGCVSYKDPKAFSITASGQTYHIRLENFVTHSYLVSSLATDEKKENLVSEWKLDYPVFNFGSADIDGDGINDILVGVIKKTKYDSVSRKRIFIFKILDGYIRPLWLGSRVSQPLEDFKAIALNNTTIIRTIEIEQTGTYLVAEYQWKGFGLSFLQYLVRNVSISEARQQLTDINAK